MQTTTSGSNAAVLRLIDSRHLLISDQWDHDTALLLTRKDESASFEAAKFLRQSVRPSKVHELDPERRHDLIAEAVAWAFIVAQEADALIGLADESRDLDQESAADFLGRSDPIMLITAARDLDDLIAEKRRVQTSLRFAAALLGRRQPQLAVNALISPRRLGTPYVPTLAEALLWARDVIRERVRALVAALSGSQLHRGAAARLLYPPRLLSGCQQTTRTLPDRAPPTSPAVTLTACAA